VSFSVLVFPLAVAGCTDPEDVTLLPHEGLSPGVRYTLDLDGDDVVETLALDDGRLTITDGDIVYHSRPKWHVVCASVGDTDHDGLTEVVTLLDDESGRHIGLFACFGGQYRERLVTSELTPRPLSLRIVDSLEAPGVSDLRTTFTGDVIILTEAPAGEQGTAQEIVYRWNGFGFTALERPPSD